MTLAAPVTLVRSAADLLACRDALQGEPQVAFDLESNGLFVYSPRICILQLALADRVFVIDALELDLGPLGELLGPGGPLKIVHDVSFDARMLSEADLPLGHVHDTSLAARLLGRTATGLGSLLEKELGVLVDKSLQQHDWSRRPLEARHLTYLAGDVAHLFDLDARLFGEAASRGILPEIDEETRHRLSTASGAKEVPDSRPPYLRMKGIDRVPADDLPLLRALAALRERAAARLDVPPYKIVGNEVLFEVARRRPRSMDELRRIRGATQGRAGALAREILLAVEEGLDDPAIPEEDRARLSPPRPPPAVAKARRTREGRLTAWRALEAEKRAVDAQVVLPGHVLRKLAEQAPPTLEALGAIAGLGAFRVERDGPTLLTLVGSESVEPAP